MELLLALVVTSIVILYFFAIEKIGRQDLLNTDYRTKVQNNVSYVLDHITTNITGRKKLLADNITYQIRGGAIGNTRISPYPVDTTSGIGGDNAIKIYIDSNNNGKLDPGSGSSEDKQIAYRYRPSSASPAEDRYQIWYYPNYTDNPNDSDAEVVTQRKISPDFSTNAAQPTHITYSVNNNYIGIQATACWDPDGNPNACGTTDNPSITMSTRIKMPSVSTN